MPPSNGSRPGGKIAALAVGLVLLLVLAPWGRGRILEARVNRNIDTLLAVSPSIRIVDRQWKSGWFGSEQMLTFEVALPGIDSRRGAGRR